MNRLFAASALVCSLSANAFAQDSQPEVTACKASALVALREKSPAIKDVILDPDSLSIATANTKIESTTIKTIIFGEAYLKTDKSDKPQQMLCIIGEKGKVLLTFFTQH